MSRLFADRCIDGIEANVERLPGLRRVVAVDRHVAQPLHRLREGGRDHQGVASAPAAASASWCSSRACMTDEELDRALDVLA